MNKIEHEDVRSYAQKYLNMGEWIMDNSIVFMSNSSYFVRNNGNNNDHWFSIPYTFLHLTPHVAYAPAHHRTLFFFPTLHHNFMHVQEFVRFFLITIVGSKSSSRVFTS